MTKAEDLIEWLINNSKEYSYDDLKRKFEIALEEWEEIKKVLLERGFLVEIKEGIFITSQRAIIFSEKFKQDAPPLIEQCFKNLSNIQGADPSVINDWSQLNEIEQFVIYPGEDKIYEIKIKNKTIKIEGKEIVDYNIFILRFFEEFGVMLPKYKGIANDWGKLVTHWHKTYGKVAKDMSETLSVSLEAREAIVDYINSCVVSDDYIVKDGMVTYKNGCIYVPTRLIKKFLKRNEFFITIRKLGYVMKDVLLSGSIPLKIENKSERFWRLDPKKFDLKLEGGLHIEKEKDAESVEVKEEAQEKESKEKDFEKKKEASLEKEAEDEEEEEEEGGFDDA